MNRLENLKKILESSLEKEITKKNLSFTVDMLKKQ